MEKIGIFMPAYNEEETLESNVLQVYDRVKDISADADVMDVIIVNNNSTDRTGEIAEKLAKENRGIINYFVEQRGKGAAIKYGWLGHDYDINAFMDVDLSTGLSALSDLIKEIKSGYDIAIGSRYIKKSIVSRSLKREMISRTYRGLFHILFGTDIADPQCGFKAINKKVKDNVLAKVENEGFFFDTELLVRAHNAGYKIKEVPVIWHENPSSTVNFKKDVPKFLKGLMRLKYEKTAN